MSSAASQSQKPALQGVKNKQRKVIDSSKKKIIYNLSNKYIYICFINLIKRLRYILYIP